CGAAGTSHSGPHPAVTGDEVDPVAGAGGEGRAQQGRGHRAVQTRHVLDPARGGPRRVEDEDDAAVALGLPGAYDDMLPPGGRAPVDGPDVVALDVVAQRVEPSA